MPIYEYYCDKHQTYFDHFASIADRDKSVNCPRCGETSQRVISAPSLAIMSKENRTAWARNEKSAHEPNSAKKHVCGHGCNHHHHHSSSKTDNSNSGMKMQPNQRPWMLGH